MIETLVNSSDAELRRIIDACRIELERRKYVKEQSERIFRNVLKSFFQNDIRRLAFISENSFRAYKDVNDEVFRIAVKEMNKNKVVFYKD